MIIMCFTCHSNPAGHPESPYSAYCAGCQPRSTQTQLERSQSLCAACKQIFATFTDFDAHQRWQASHVSCRDPAAAELELEDGIWGTPEGNTNRRTFTDRMLSAKRARSARMGVSLPTSP
jgi:hypothetical protein